MVNFKFTETPNTSAKVIDTVTLTTNEYLSFPTFFLQRYKIREMGESVGLKLFYDSDNKAIAIQFVEDSESGLYRLNISEKYGATSKVKAFLLNNGLDIAKYAGKYEYEQYSASSLGLNGPDVFVLKLDNGGGAM